MQGPRFGSRVILLVKTNQAIKFTKGSPHARSYLSLA